MCKYIKKPLKFKKQKKNRATRHIVSLSSLWEEIGRALDLHESLPILISPFSQHDKLFEAQALITKFVFQKYWKTKKFYGWDGFRD